MLRRLLDRTNFVPAISLCRERLTKPVGFDRAFGRIFFRNCCGFGVCRLRAHILHAAASRDGIRQIVVVLFQIHEVGDVEKRITLQSDVDECRLHAGKHAGDFPFVDGAS